MDLLLYKDNFIFVISCLDIFAVSLVVSVFTQYLQSLGYSNFHVGILNSSYSFVQFFASPIVGHLSDVYGSRRTLFASLFVCALCYPILGSVVSFAPLFLVRCVTGFVKHTQLLCKNYIEESWSSNDVAAGNGNTHIKQYSKLTGYSSMGFVLGPIISGYMIQSSHDEGFFRMTCVTGLMFAVNCAFVYALDDKRAAESSNKSKRASRTGNRAAMNLIDSLRNIPWLVCWDILSIKCCTVFAVFAFYVNYNQSVAQRFAISPLYVGFSYSFQALVRTVANFFMHRVDDAFFPAHFSKLHKIRRTYAIMVAALFALYLSPSIYVYVGCLIPLNVCVSYLRIINHETLIERTKSYDKGVILGAFHNVTAIARFVLPLVTGIIVDKFGYDSVYLVSTASLITGIAIISFCGKMTIVDKAKSD